MTIWVEKLSIINMVFLQCLSIFYKIRVKYDKHQISGFSVILINLLQKIRLCKSFYSVSLSLNKKNSEGAALTYQMEKELDYCLESFCRVYIAKDEDWFKNMAKSYIASHLFSRIRFIAMVISELEGQDNHKNIIFLSRHPVNSVILSFYKEKGFTIWQSPCLIENIKFYIRPLYFMLGILVSNLYPFKIKTNILNIRPSIWVEYTHNDLCNFMFWRNSAHSEQFDIVYYIDRSDTSATTEIINEIEQQGLKWIDSHFFQVARMSTFSNKHLKELATVLFSVHSSTPSWFKVFKFENTIWYVIFISVYKLFNVKILIQHQESSWKQGIQAKALEAVNGIMIGFNWSNVPHHMLPTHITPQHVYFVWAKATLEWVKKKGNSCRYILPSGLWIVPVINSSKPISNFSKNIKFIITIFDSSVGYNIHQSPETLSQFYLTIIKILEVNQAWAGIIKSKNCNNIHELGYLPLGSEIVSKIAALIKQERIIFLNTLDHPAVAASYADLSVCYGLNSAGIIAGIYGHKAIHWDCCGWVEHPFYKKKDQKIIYQSISDFEDAILKAGTGDKDIGDFACWREKFNHFNDYLASERVGEFIQEYMNEIIKTNDMEHSLCFAAEQYIKTNKVPESFFEANGLFSQEGFNTGVLKHC